MVISWLFYFISLPLQQEEQLAHGVGKVFRVCAARRRQTYWFWCLSGNASCRHIRYNIRKGRLRDVLSSLFGSLVNFFMNDKKMMQSKRPRGWLLWQIAHSVGLYTMVYMYCVMSEAYLFVIISSAWANWLLILIIRVYQSLKQGISRRYSNPRLFHIPNFIINSRLRGRYRQRI